MQEIATAFAISSHNFTALNTDIAVLNADMAVLNTDFAALNADNAVSAEAFAAFEE